MRATVKVLFLVNSPGPNTHEIYKGLSAASYMSVDVWCLKLNNIKWKNNLDLSGVVYKQMRNRNPFAKSERMAICPEVIKAILTQKYDVIVLQGYSTVTHFVALLLLSLIPSQKWFFWGERMRRTDHESYLKKLIKKVIISKINTANWVYGVGTKGVVNYISLGVDNKKISSLTYSKDLSSYTFCKDACEVNHKRRRRIVCTSRLVDSKRIDLLIDAFITLAEDFREWDLSIVGDGPALDKLRDRVPNDLHNRVVWHGYAGVSEQCEIYAMSDVFVLPSEHDGWGMVLLEAMAAGLPVIATEGVMSAWDLIDEGETGFKIPVADKVAMVSALALLMRDDELREKIGGRGKGKVKLWSLGEVVARLEADLQKQIMAME